MEFFHDGITVGLHGANTDLKFARDLLVGVALNDELENVILPVREQRRHLPPGRSIGVAKFLDEHLRDRRTKK